MPWLVKDYADGWITFQRGEDALREVEQMGEALLRFVPDTPDTDQEAG